VGLEIVGLELDGAAELPRGIEVPCLGGVRTAYEVHGGRELRVDLQRILQLDGRLVVLALGVVPLGFLKVSLLDNGGILCTRARDQRKVAGRDESWQLPPGHHLVFRDPHLSWRTSTLSYFPIRSQSYCR
jgi:hypothetical protein